MKLSKTVINQAKYEHGGKHLQIIWDSALPSFGLRLYASGEKSFVVKYRLNGRTVLDTVAPVDLISLDAAREKARLFLIKAYEERSAVLAVVKERYFDEFCDEYVARYAKLHKISWKEDQRRCEIYLKPAWAKRKVSTIRRSDICLLLDKIGQTKPTMANRVREQLSKMFECAVLWGFVPEQMKNPARGIPDFHETVRDRWFDETELHRLLQAVSEEPNYFARVAIITLLFTGLRKNECLKLKWAQVDLEKGQLYIPRTSRKNRKPLVVPLSKTAIDVLNSIPRHVGNEYVFPGRERGKPLFDLKGPWRRLCERAGLKDAHLHDLRHTLGASLAQNGVDLWLISKVLGHSGIASTMRYAHLSTRETQKALDAHAEMIQSILELPHTIDQGSETVLCEKSQFGSISFSIAAG